MSGEPGNFTIAAVYEGDVQAPMRAMWRVKPHVHPPVMLLLDGADLPSVPGAKPGFAYTVMLTEGWLGPAAAGIGEEELVRELHVQFEAETRKLGLQLLSVGMVHQPIDSFLEGIRSGSFVLEMSTGAGKTRPFRDG